MAAALTENRIAEVVAGFGGFDRLELADTDEPGLRLRIGETAARWSVLTRGPMGERTRMPLGSWPAVSLERARTIARALKQTFASADPGEVDELAVVTLLERYRARRLSQLRQGAVMARALDITLGPLKYRRASELTRREIGVVIDDLADRAPIHANRVLAYTKAFFNWAVGRGYIEANPAASITKPTRERTRDRTPSLHEVADIWLAAKALGYPFGPIVRLIILTAARRDEVGAMRVAEILDPATGKVADCWTLPAERSKNGRAIRVLLSPAAQDEIAAALDSRPVDCPFVFSTNGEASVSGWSRAKSRLDNLIDAACLKRKAPRPEPWRFHDLRRSFATHACDLMHFDPIVVDRCLNHVGASTTSTVSRIYARNELFDQRCEALRQWAELVEKAAQDRLKAPAEK